MSVIMHVTLVEALGIADTFPEDSELRGETWALTWFGESPAVSVYTIAPNSWAVFNDVLYGAMDGGIYAMDADDGRDGTDAFTTAMLLIKSDYGTSLPKSIRRVYVEAHGSPVVAAAAGAGARQQAVKQLGAHLFPRTGLDVEWTVGVQGFTELFGLEIYPAILPRRRA